MTNVHRIYTSRQYKGVLGAIVVALLVSTLYFGSHTVPIAGDERQSANVPSKEASSPDREGAFVYFPSQYQLKAPETPEEQPPTF